MYTKVLISRDGDFDMSDIKGLSKVIYLSGSQR